MISSYDDYLSRWIMLSLFPVLNLSSLNSRSHHTSIDYMKETAPPYVVNYGWLIKMLLFLLFVIWTDSTLWHEKESVWDYKVNITCELGMVTTEISYWKYRPWPGFNLPNSGCYSWSAHLLPRACTRIHFVFSHTPMPWSADHGRCQHWLVENPNCVFGNVLQTLHYTAVE